MPRYDFRFRDDEVPSFDGAEFANDEAARQEAMHCARDLLVEQLLHANGERPTGMAVRVFAQDGSQIAAVRFEDVPEEGIAP